MRTNQSVQIRLVRFLGSVTAPGVVLCEFPLLKVVAELCDRKRASTKSGSFPSGTMSLCEARLRRLDLEICWFFAEPAPAAPFWRGASIKNPSRKFSPRNPTGQPRSDCWRNPWPSTPVPSLCTSNSQTFINVSESRRRTRSAPRRPNDNKCQNSAG